MKKAKIITFLLTVLIIYINLVSCHKEGDTGKSTTPPPSSNDYGLHLPTTPYDYVDAINSMPSLLSDYIKTNPTVDNTPTDNPITNAGATLGRVLFYDSSLSINNKISCSSCHHQNHGFADTIPLSKGFLGGFTKRNAMPVVNVRFFQAKKMFWDLRAADLETQTLIPIQDQIEMGMTSLSALEAKVSQQPYYAQLFKNAFGTTDITSDKISKALSQFVRSIVSFGSRYDQGIPNNFKGFSASEQRGMQVFTANFCGECHSDLQHTGEDGKSIPTFLIVENYGMNTGFGANDGLDATFTDLGIGGITQNPNDYGDFKIPSLRNVELTAPYMHDGRFSTLEQAVEHYASGIQANPNLGIQLRNPGIPFTDQQKSDLVAFLKTLTDQSLAADPKYSSPFK